MYPPLHLILIPPLRCYYHQQWHRHRLRHHRQRTPKHPQHTYLPHTLPPSTHRWFSRRSHHTGRSARSPCTLSAPCVRAGTAAHTSHERALVKVLTTGQNLAVTDTAHEQLHAVGTLVEEALDEDEDEDVGMGIGGSVATVKTSTFEKCVITGAINYVKS
jgi:hypothetical protein